MSLKFKYISIEGNIGAGKTTLATQLSEKFNTQLVLEEFEENEFLPLFYKEPARYAFSVEMRFLIDRYQQLLNINKNSATIADFAFFKCLLFARVNLPVIKFNLFKRYFDLLKKQLPQPDIIIFLNTTTENLQRNILHRNRKMEVGIKDKYLQDIAVHYYQYLNDFKVVPILQINSNGIDFVKNKHAFKQMSDLLNQNHKKGITTIDLKLEDN